ncbi:glucose 1-dehydrogenase [Herbiconiux sp. VKM Ac-1786]|uniref:SDR family NAD(P)-dependent oxidoreductase n=1 Tax=Herbiconiux sp. VKM Ac-1786 TaxID=2783824 RepID=UPI00188B0827|nr:glucose 1-dehydrogenase [Herbiconiux sp. VKM Ac-1786]MBF4571843.1 glucose 1-dehydrogenase [Herbiconiux sp. VKM Ac-1786]
MPDTLSGKVALVTGAGGGIGRETVRVLLENGARVAVADISEDAGRETIEYVGAGDDAFFHKTDVTDLASFEGLVAKTVETYGRLDVAHNNAGIEFSGLDLADVPVEEFQKLIAVNYTGVFISMKAEIPQMLKQGEGSIINTASALGIVALPGQSAYVSSKHAVIGLTKAAAMEYSGRGIRVNTILPGVIRTPMIEALDVQHPGFSDMLLKEHPIGRLGLPRDIGNAVVWLGSELSSFVTGTSLLVDGGYSTH